MDAVRLQEVGACESLPQWVARCRYDGELVLTPGDPINLSQPWSPSLSLSLSLCRVWRCKRCEWMLHLKCLNSKKPHMSSDICLSLSLTHTHVAFKSQTQSDLPGPIMLQMYSVTALEMSEIGGVSVCRVRLVLMLNHSLNSQITAALFDLVFLDFVSNRWDLWGWNNKPRVSRNVWFVYAANFEKCLWILTVHVERSGNNR